MPGLRLGYGISCNQELLGRMTDVDFLICSSQGNVLLTTDEALVGLSIAVP